MILLHCCRKINIYILKTLSFRVGGGQDKLAWTAYPPGVKIIRVGGKISPGNFAPRGASCPGGQDKLLHRSSGFPTRSDTNRREFAGNKYRPGEFAGNKDNYNISHELEFRPDLTSDWS